VCKENKTKNQIVKEGKKKSTINSQFIKITDGRYD